jgi:hypothetical protein
MIRGGSGWLQGEVDMAIYVEPQDSAWKETWQVAGSLIKLMSTEVERPLEYRGTSSGRTADRVATMRATYVFMARLDHSGVSDTSYYPG